MEMFLGDLPLVLSLLKSSTTPKSVFILTNMFSPEQNIYFLSHNRLNEINWIETIKGKFTSLVIIDADRLDSNTLILVKSILAKDARL